jgi:hypothetical protein
MAMEEVSEEVPKKNSQIDDLTGSLQFFESPNASSTFKNLRVERDFDLGVIDSNRRDMECQDSYYLGSK